MKAVVSKYQKCIAYCKKAVSRRWSTDGLLKMGLDMGY